MRRFLLSLIISVCISAFSLGQSSEDAIKWIGEQLASSKFANKGKLDFCITFTTGHFGTNPVLAEESRTFVSELLYSLAAKEDSLRIASMELDIWDIKEPLSLSKLGLRPLSNYFPKSPASNSKGGRDIERGLFNLIQKISGRVIFIVISPGPSQVASDGSGKLFGANNADFKRELASRCYCEPVQERVEFKNTKALISLLIPKDLSSKDGSKRTPLNNPTIKHKNSSPELAIKPTKSSQTLSDFKFLVIGIVIGTILALSYARLRNHKNQREVLEVMDSTGDLSQSHQVETDELKKIAKRFDMSIQDFESSTSLLDSTASVIQGEIKKLQHHILDNSTLRNEIISQQELLKEWDFIAIEFIDAATRVAHMNGVSEERKESWSKAAKDYKRLCLRRGLDTIEPTEGDEYSPGLHQIRELDGNLAVHVTKCIEIGFRRGEKIIRPAVVDCGP